MIKDCANLEFLIVIFVLYMTDFANTIANQRYLF